MNVLVTAIGSGGHGEQVLKALRLAGEGEYQIFGADINSAAANQQLVNEFITLPRASENDFVIRLIEFCDAKSISAVFHGCEPDMFAISGSRKLFEERGIYLGMNSAELIGLCSDKFATAAKLQTLGYATPQTVLCSDGESIENVDFFPVVVKPSVGGGGSSRVFIAENQSQLKAITFYLSSQDSGVQLVIQEYVGNSESEFTVGVLHDSNGDFIDSIALHKELKTALSVRERLRSRSDDRGIADLLTVSSGVSQGIIGKFSEVTDVAREIAERLGSVGPLNFQGRIHNGSFCVFEINPRLSGTTSMRAVVGFNEPDLMIRRNLLKQEVPTNQKWSTCRVTRRLVEEVSLGDS